MLFKDIADLKRALPRVSKSHTFADFEPFITLAEEKYVIPFIGREFYEELNDAYASTPTDDQLTAIRNLQLAIGNYAHLEALPHLPIQIGTSGVGIGTSQTTMPVPQWQFNKLESQTALQAETFLDLALAYLEENANNFATWQASEAFLESKSLFINNAKTLSLYVPIFGSRRAYLALRPFIALAQEETIIEILGQTLHDSLISKQQTNSLSEIEKKLCRMIAKALGCLAARQGFAQMAVSFDGTGFRLLSTNDGIVKRDAMKPEQLQSILADFANRAEIQLVALKAFLQANLTDFPDYEDSPNFIADSEDKKYIIPDNSNKKSFTI